jgi:hypothetical protein
MRGSLSTRGPLLRWAAALGRRPWTAALGVVALAALGSVTVALLQRGEPRSPQVQVLNGSGIPELAQLAAEKLRARGLDVVAVGNADSQGYTRTLVLSRRGPLAVARQVRDALARGEVLEERDATLLVDVTVILGSDYQDEVRGR